MMDANEAMGKDKNGVSTVASDCDLIDVHTARHNEAATIATYARGTKKIDYMLITPELLPLVVKSGMLPFYTGIHTDHWGLYRYRCQSTIPRKNRQILLPADADTIIKNAEDSTQVQIGTLETTASPQHTK
jgi:hypothetical protein